MAPPTATAPAEARRRTPHLAHAFATFDVGGPQVRTLAVRDALGERYHHSFVAADGNTGARRLFGTRPAPLAAAPRPAGGPRQLHWLREHLRREGPDLVLTYNWGAILAAAAAASLGIPFIHHEEVVPDDEHLRLLWRREWLRRLVLPHARAVVFPARDLAASALRRWGLTADRCHVIHNGTDTRHHQPNDRSRAATSRTTIGCVAHARPEKNWPRLLEAFALLPGRSSDLLLVGDGPTRPDAEARCRSLGICERVTMLGDVEDTAHAYRRMDIFVLASNHEQHPLALLEAMAHGLPIVATDVGDVRATLPGCQHDLLIPADASPQHLADRIAELLDDRSRRSELGDANRRAVVTRFDLRETARTYANLYDEALGSSQGSRRR